jgi:hypothetical protein
MGIFLPHTTQEGSEAVHHIRQGSKVAAACGDVTRGCEPQAKPRRRATTEQMRIRQHEAMGRTPWEVVVPARLPLCVLLASPMEAREADDARSPMLHHRSNGSTSQPKSFFAHTRSRSPMLKLSLFHGDRDPCLPLLLVHTLRRPRRVVPWQRCCGSGDASGVVRLSPQSVVGA